MVLPNLLMTFLSVDRNLVGFLVGLKHFIQGITLCFRQNSFLSEAVGE